ncbi:MAG TPA: putative O-glycosylation ligase, exosortase A system-associated, partial [Planctomycetota bacterium]|nr:putative O-glycosylation ligase, exosortase A system-associated [Planctomycetota bacterium]
MRDLIISAIIFSLMPVAFRRPYVGLVIFSWLAYMRVQDLTWGFARDFRWSFYIAIIMVAGYVSKRGGRLFVQDIRCYMMLAMGILVGLGVVFGDHYGGFHLSFQISKYVEFVKIIGIALFTTAVVRTREHLRLLVWVIALSLGFYGVKNGVWGIMTFGQVPILRGPGGMLFDNNDLSLALGMAVPMLWHIGTSEKRPVLRRAFLAMVPLTMFTVLLTHSRGGLLSLVGGLGVLVWRSRHRGIAIVLAIFASIVGVIVMPPEMRERFASIADYQSDGSANARLRSWAVAIRMSADNPILGVGLSSFRQNYLQYQPNPTMQELAGKDIYVAHNSYLQIWAETGTPCLILYLGLLVMSFFTVWKVRRLAQQRFHTSWLINYATMFEATLVSFTIGATFLNRAHFDLFYHWVAIVLLFGYIAKHELSDTARYPVKSGAGRGELRAVDPAGFDGRRRVRRRA